MEDKKICRWVAIGRKHRIKSGTLQPLKKHIDIKEYARSVTIPAENEKTCEPYGIPIDGKLAVQLIADLHRALPEPIKNLILYGQDIDYSKQLDSATTKEICDWLIQLLKRSAAITIDKNIMLKIISQPRCEGIRFYLCKKSDDTTKQDFLSLVTVGVDFNGFDLHYGDIKDKPVVKEIPFSEIKTESDTGEYAHPPDGVNKKTLSDSYGDRYVLLKYALGSAKAIPGGKKKNVKRKPR